MSGRVRKLWQEFKKKHPNFEKSKLLKSDLGDLLDHHEASRSAIEQADKEYWVKYKSWCDTREKERQKIRKEHAEATAARLAAYEKAKKAADAAYEAAGLKMEQGFRSAELAITNPIKKVVLEGEKIQDSCRAALKGYEEIVKLCARDGDKTIVNDFGSFRKIVEDVGWGNPPPPDVFMGPIYFEP
jgi:SHS2 domain-containing protein